MKNKIYLRALFLLFVMAAIASNHLVVAQAAEEFKPSVGQEGKDVIWVPTPQGLVDKMLDMAKVTPKDYVIDLGSGDGRTVITAAKRGAKRARHRVQPRHGRALQAHSGQGRRQRQSQFSSKPIFSRATFPRPR
jgi:hypothetical protein